MINNDNLQINQSLIKNNYYIVDNLFKDEFNIVIYFITNNKCKILIRRLDCIGWGQDLKIKLMDIKDDKFEKISLGSCEENLKIIEIYTKINLYSNKVLETIIPKVIIIITLILKDINLKLQIIIFYKFLSLIFENYFFLHLKVVVVIIFFNYMI